VHDFLNRCIHLLLVTFLTIRSFFRTIFLTHLCPVSLLFFLFYEFFSVHDRYELCALLCLNAIIQSVFLHAYFHLAFRTGMRVKAAMITAVYDKALKAKEGAAEMTAATAAAADGKSSASRHSPGRSSENKKFKNQGGYAALDNGTKAAAGSSGGGESNKDRESREARAHEDEAKADMRTKKKTVGEVGRPDTARHNCKGSFTCSASLCRQCISPSRPPP